MNKLAKESEFIQGLIKSLINQGEDPVKIALQFANIPPLYRNTSFENLDSSREPEAFEICQQYANKGKYQGKRGLCLSGLPGNGKTSLAVATMRRYVEVQGGDCNVYFVDLTSVLADLRNSFGDPESRIRPEGFQQIAQGNDCLIIDDLGQQKMTEWVEDQLYSLINTLYTQYKKVIVTTNLPIEKLIKDMNYALISRILGMCHEIRITGDDYRISPASLQE